MESDFSSCTGYFSIITLLSFAYCVVCFPYIFHPLWGQSPRTLPYSSLWPSLRWHAGAVPSGCPINTLEEMNEFQGQDADE